MLDYYYIRSDDWTGGFVVRSLKDESDWNSGRTDDETECRELDRPTLKTTMHSLSHMRLGSHDEERWGGSMMRLPVRADINEITEIEN